MKINDRDDIRMFKMSHRGAQLKFGRIMVSDDDPGDFEYRNPNKEVTFEFDDLREVDQLITMLTAFRDGCIGRIGEWERSRNEDNI